MKLQIISWVTGLLHGSGGNNWSRGCLLFCPLLSFLLPRSLLFWGTCCGWWVIWSRRGVGRFVGRRRGILRGGRVWGWRLSVHLLSTVNWWALFLPILSFLILTLSQAKEQRQAESELLLPPLECTYSGPTAIPPSAFPTHLEIQAKCTVDCP